MNQSVVQQSLERQKEIWIEVSERVLRDHPKAESALPPSKRILLFGEGSSYHAAKLVSYALGSVLPKLTITATSSSAVGMEIQPQKGDWCFGLSHRGKTAATLRALERCRKAEASGTWVAAQGTPAPGFKERVIFTSPLEQCEPHTYGLTGAIVALSTHFGGKKIAERWRELAGEPNPDLMALRAKVNTGPDLLLGEWVGEWIARESALKLMEMARIRVPAYGSEEFFHGPQVFSRARPAPENLWYLASAGDLRRDDILSFVPAAAISVTECGESKSSNLGERTRGEKSLAWIPALVEMQWRALAVALNRDVNPDGI
jgi:fructoselysine-6-P-deglycase FrlB-like protein